MSFIPWERNYTLEWRLLYVTHLFLQGLSTEWLDVCTHIEFKVFGRGVDAASGWVVTWYVVHCHMLDPHRMRESDGKSSLGTSEWPTPPWEHWCQTLGREEMQLGNNTLLYITNSHRLAVNNTPNHRRYKENREGGDHSLYLNNSPWAHTDGPNPEN